MTCRLLSFLACLPLSFIGVIYLRLLVRVAILHWLIPLAFIVLLLLLLMPDGLLR